LDDKTSAVYKAKDYFTTLIAFAVIDLFFALSMDRPEPALSAVRRQGFVGVVQSVIISVFWIICLKQSKRIHATYNQPFNEF
jgi:hypothetical protein